MALATVGLYFALVFVVSGREIPDNLDARIVGGTVASDGKYPYQVALRVYFEYFCGGSILNDRWILTAAQCIVGKRPDEISVTAGTNFLSEAGQLYQVVSKVTHPEYDADWRINDIGLVRVSRQIVYTDRIQPISLPTENFNQTNYPATLTGWGRTSLDDDLSENLREISLMVISQKICRALQPNITESHICTLTKIGEGACYGDSGNPLVVDGEQIGILSFGSPCARGYPDVYTRVWSFANWIYESMNKTDEQYFSMD